MPSKKIVCLHTSPTLTPLFSELFARHAPEAQLQHMVDESLIKNTIAAGHLERTTMRRTIDLIGLAFEGGADAVLVTCSSIGPGVDIAAQLYDSPVVRVDAAMAERAVNVGRRIGVVATLGTTLAPTRDLVQRSADAIGKPIELVDCLCEGAFDALMAGDPATHDRIVGAALTGLESVDVIVLAQASIARVLAGLPEGAVKAPVLSSPELGVQRVCEVVFGKRQAQANAA